MIAIVALLQVLTLKFSGPKSWSGHDDAALQLVARCGNIIILK